MMNRYIWSQKKKANSNQEPEPEPKEENKGPTVPKGVVTDLELIQVATQAGVHLEVDIHLFMVIEDVIFHRKQEKDKWEFRCNRNGTMYWINPDTFVTRKQYPYLKEVMMRVRALKKTLLMTALKKTKKSKRKSTPNQKDEYHIKPSLLMKTEEINQAFSTMDGKLLDPNDTVKYSELLQKSQKLTQKMLYKKLKKSEAPRVKKEFKDELEAITSQDEDSSQADANNMNDDLKDIENTDLLFQCPFRFEKRAKSKNANASDTDSSDSLNLEELADFNKIMERHLKENIKKEFHEKFHNIDKLQNKEIDKKLVKLARQRNVGQLKYMMKKKMHNIKDDIENVKEQLEKLDEGIEEFPDDHLVSNTKEPDYFFGMDKKSKSAVPRMAKRLSRKTDRSKSDVYSDEANMQEALGRFKRKYKMDTIDDVYRAISKLKNKDVGDKFSKFVSHFKSSMKSRKSSTSKKSDKMEMNEKEMLEEIAKFVSSKDFNKFFKKMIKKTNSPSPTLRKGRYNRGPKNVEVKRVKSPLNKSRLSRSDAPGLKIITPVKSQASDKQKKTPLTAAPSFKNKLVEFTCGLVDLPALKKKYLSKKKKNLGSNLQQNDPNKIRRKSFLQSNKDENELESPESKTKQKIVAKQFKDSDEEGGIQVQLRRRISHIRVTKDNKQVVTSAEEDSLSSDTSISDLIIKMEVKDIKSKFQRNIERDIKDNDKKFMKYKNLSKQYSKADVSEAGDNKMSHLENFRDKDPQEYRKSGFKDTKDYGNALPKLRLEQAKKSLESKESSGSEEESPESPARRLDSSQDKGKIVVVKKVRSRIPDVKLKRFTSEHDSSVEEDKKAKPKQKFSHVNQYESLKSIKTFRSSMSLTKSNKKIKSIKNKRNLAMKRLSLGNVMNKQDEAEKDIFQSLSEDSEVKPDPEIEKDKLPLTPNETPDNSKVSKGEVEKFFQQSNNPSEEMSKSSRPERSKTMKFEEKPNKSMEKKLAKAKRIINLKTLRSEKEDLTNFLEDKSIDQTPPAITPFLCQKPKIKKPKFEGIKFFQTLRSRRENDKNNEAKAQKFLGTDEELKALAYSLSTCTLRIRKKSKLEDKKEVVSIVKERDRVRNPTSTFDLSDSTKTGPSNPVLQNQNLAVLQLPNNSSLPSLLKPVPVQNLPTLEKSTNKFTSHIHKILEEVKPLPMQSNIKMMSKHWVQQVKMAKNFTERLSVQRASSVDKYAYRRFPLGL